MRASMDWSPPWLAPYRALGEPAWRRSASASVAQALQAAWPAVPGEVVFVPHLQLPQGVAYEAYIHATQRVPTRDNLHDFFNGLVWLHFPQTKRRLNALQAAEIAHAGIGPVRGPVRDAATVFDENAALLDAPGELWQALLARDWRGLFVDLRGLWPQARLIVFGHAALEKLVHPRKDITVHVLCTRLPFASPAALDAALAAELTPDRLAEKPFTPLPVLGIPDWFHGNCDFSFYDDATVFRPRRAHKKYDNIDTGFPNLKVA